MREAGTTIDEMLDPAYWANVANRLNVRPQGIGANVPDIVYVSPADGSWWAELLVRDVAPFTALVHVLRHIEFDKKAAAIPSKVPDGYDIRNRGKNGWQVVRKSDNVVLKEGLATQATAAAYLDTHLKTFAQG